MFILFYFIGIDGIKAQTDTRIISTMLCLRALGDLRVKFPLLNLELELYVS